MSLLIFLFLIRYFCSSDDQLDENSVTYVLVFENPVDESTYIPPNERSRLTFEKSVRSNRMEITSEEFKELEEDFKLFEDMGEFCPSEEEKEINIRYTMDEFILTKNYLEKIKKNEDFTMNPDKIFIFFEILDFLNCKVEHPFIKYGLEVYNNRSSDYSGDDFFLDLYSKMFEPQKRVEYKREEKELILSVDLDIKEFEMCIKYLWLIKDIDKLTMRGWDENNPTLVNLLMKDLDKFKNISKLDISRSKGLWNQIGQKLEIFQNLTHLNISDNSIGDKGAEYISKLPNLTHLNISNNSIGVKGAESISKLPNLTYLNISNNSIGDKGAEYISKLPNLTHLNISYNSIGVKGAEYISKLPNLTYLDISYNSIGDEGAESISKLPNLTHLNISYNSIGDKGAESISKLPNLTYLDISYNSIGDEGAEYISKLPNLTYLNISYNSIGDKGAEYISKLQNLTHLNISDNSIGDKGAEYISKLPNLTYLNISYNSIGDEGAEYISKLPNLTYLNIS